jgi:ABC-2 type transport system permease protein
MAASRDALRSTRTQVTLRSRFIEIAGYRELLVNLVRKELKVRYKNSVLGFVWSLVNPAVTIGVYYVIFTLVFNNPIPKFVIFLMSGVLVWNMFSTALGSAVSSVVGNAPLVKKVYFPREILPLASIGAAMVDFFLQSSVLIVALAAFQWRIGWAYLPLIPIALVVAVLFTASLALWLSAVNVRYRDVQHFLAIALMVWFWGTPIIYSYQQVATRLSQYHLGNLLLLNPFTSVTLAFQRALYNKRVVNVGKPTQTQLMPNHGYLWDLGIRGAVAAVSLVLLVLAARVFRRLEGDFAESL